MCYVEPADHIYFISGAVDKDSEPTDQETKATDWRAEAISGKQPTKVAKAISSKLKLDSSVFTQELSGELIK